MGSFRIAHFCLSLDIFLFLLCAWFVQSSFVFYFIYVFIDHLFNCWRIVVTEEESLLYRNILDNQVQIRKEMQLTSNDVRDDIEKLSHNLNVFINASQINQVKVNADIATLAGRVTVVENSLKTSADSQAALALTMKNGFANGGVTAVLLGIAYVIQHLPDIATAMINNIGPK